MGLLTIENEISHEFLNLKKFNLCRGWGGPVQSKENPNEAFFYENIHYMDTYPYITIAYFPTTFNKYVTYFAWKGEHPAGNILVYAENADIEFHMKVEDEGDIIFAINKVKQIIKQFNS